MRKNTAFTLVELMLVVAILGILAAIVLPQLSANTLQAKESAAKDTLSTWRGQIEMYKMQHNGKYPGYKGVMQASPDVDLVNQFIGTSRVDGFAVSAAVPAAPYNYGPYLKKIPENPFNNKSSISYVPLATAFSAAANGTSSGWLYKKETGEIRLNWTGTDRDGRAYTDY